MDGAVDPNSGMESKNQKEFKKDGLLNRFLLRGPRNQRMPSDAGRRTQSMSDASLKPPHDAVAKVFCDGDGRHLVQVGITDFFGDLLSPSYAVVFAIDYEPISIGRGFRQHGFIDA